MDLAHLIEVDRMKSDLFFHKTEKYFVEIIKIDQQGWRVVITSNPQRKTLLMYHFEEEYFLTEIFFLRVIKRNGNHLFLFRVVYKEYMYDFIQNFSFLVIDPKKRDVYRTQLSEEGTFDNVRDEDGVYLNDKLYYWD